MPFYVRSHDTNVQNLKVGSVFSRLRETDPQYTVVRYLSKPDRVIGNIEVEVQLLDTKCIETLRFQWSDSISLYQKVEP